MTDSANLDLVFTGSDQGASAEYEKLSRENDRLVEKLKSVARTSKDSAKEEVRSRREVAKIYEQTNTPLEEYQKNVRELQVLLNRGLLDEERYARRRKQLQQEYLRQTREAKRATGDSLREQRREMTRTEMAAQRFGGSLKSLAAGAVGISTITAAFRAVSAEMMKLEQRATAASVEVETLFRKFEIQADISGLQSDQARRRLLQEAVYSGETDADTKRAAQQLISSGFLLPEVLKASDPKNSALRAFQTVLRANAVTGQDVDPVETAAAISGFLKAQGKGLTAENLLAAGRNTHALFQSTSLQLSDLTALSAEGAGFVNRKTGEVFLSEREQLGAMSLLRDANIVPSRAATGLRNLTSVLQGAALNNTARETLESIGLTPDQVDLKGESFVTALKRIDAALSNSPNPEASLQKLFGREVSTVAATLIQQVDRGEKSLIERIRIQEQGSEAFDRGEERLRTGPQAARNRAVTLRTYAETERAADGDLYRQALDIFLSKVNASAAIRTAAVELFEKQMENLVTPPDVAGQTVIQQLFRRDAIVENARRQVNEARARGRVPNRGLVKLIEESDAISPNVLSDIVLQLNQGSEDLLDNVFDQADRNILNLNLDESERQQSGSNEAQKESVEATRALNDSVMQLNQTLQNQAGQIAPNGTVPTQPVPQAPIATPPATLKIQNRRPKDTSRGGRQ